MTGSGTEGSGARAASRNAHAALDKLGVPRERDGCVLTLEARCVMLNRLPLPLPEMMGTKEAAAELGVSTSNLGKLKDLPPPAIDYLSRGGLWRARDIRKFSDGRRGEEG